MPYIDYMTGTERDITNGRSAVAELYLFRLPINPTTSAVEPGKVELPIGRACQFNIGGLRSLAATPTPAFVGMPVSEGKWTTGRVDAPEGTVLKIQAKYASDIRHKNFAAMFIRVREEAAVRQVTMKLLRTEYSRHIQAEIKGNFDVLTLKEVLAMGHNIPKGFHAMCHKDRRRHFLFTSVVVPEISSYKRIAVREKNVKRTDGRVLKITQPKVTRRLRFNDPTLKPGNDEDDD